MRGLRFEPWLVGLGMKSRSTFGKINVDAIHRTFSFPFRGGQMTGTLQSVSDDGLSCVFHIGKYLQYPDIQPPYTVKVPVAGLYPTLASRLAEADRT